STRPAARCRFGVPGSRRLVEGGPGLPPPGPPPRRPYGGAGFFRGVVPSFGACARSARGGEVRDGPVESPRGGAQVPLHLVDVHQQVLALRAVDLGGGLGEALEQLVQRGEGRGQVSVEAHRRRSSTPSAFAGPLTAGYRDRRAEPARPARGGGPLGAPPAPEGGRGRARRGRPLDHRGGARAGRPCAVRAPRPPRRG